MNSIVEKIKIPFTATVTFSLQPFIENAKTLNMMWKTVPIRFMSEMWKRLDLAIVGIGEPISLSNALRTSMTRSSLQPYETRGGWRHSSKILQRGRNALRFGMRISSGYLLIS